MADIAVPGGLDDLTPEWLTEALRSRGYLGRGAVEAIETEEIGAGRGYMGLTARLRLSHDGSDDDPDSIIVKMPTFIEVSPEEQAMAAIAYANEIHFYADLAPSSPIAVPGSYWGGYDEQAGRYCLLLEDMAGMRETDQLTGCTQAEAELAVDVLARLHARHWQDDRLAGFDWLNGVEFGIEVVAGLFGPAWGHFADEFETLSDQVVRAGEAIAAGAVRSMAQDLLAGPLTLTHGDYRLENFMFGAPGSDRELVVLDWQGVSVNSGSNDLAYFLGLSLSTDARRANEAALIERYRRGLAASGVDHPADRLREEVRRGALLALMVPVMMTRVKAEAEEQIERLADEERALLELALSAGVPLLHEITARVLAMIDDYDATSLVA